MWYLSLTSTFFYLHCLCLSLSLRVSTGPSSWNWMDFQQILLNLVKQHRWWWHTFPCTSSCTPPLTKSRLQKTTTWAHWAFEHKNWFSNMRPLGKEIRMTSSFRLPFCKMNIGWITLQYWRMMESSKWQQQPLRLFSSVLTIIYSWRCSLSYFLLQANII